jgi:hypothetical protein
VRGIIVRTRRSTVLYGFLAAGLVLTQQACTRGDRQTGRPVAFTTPASVGPTAGSPKAATTRSGDKAAVGSSAADPILAGRRQVVIKPIPSTESIVAVDDRGRLTLTDGEAEFGLFVLAPVGDKFLIKTAKAGAGGEPSCLGIRNNGSSPLTVEATACDTRRAGQLFTITRQRADDRGRPTYAISNQGAFLQVFPRTGLIAEELGDAPLKTTYAFVDNGPADAF